jgi:hypothetical protein
MCNSERSAWSGLGPKLAARGIHALAIDYRAFGESGGERVTEPAAQQRAVRELWPRDVDAALAALRARTGLAEPALGAAGGSCGVNQAIQAAIRNPDVLALALLAGPTDAAGEAYLAANPWLPLVGVAAHDDAGAVGTTQWLLGFSSNPANELLVYEAGGHGTELFRVHDELEPKLAGFFARHLVEQPVARPAAGSAAAAPRPGPSAVLASELRAPGGPAAIRARHEAARTAGRPLEAPPEGAVNAAGYERLGAGDVNGAIELFELNAALHPASANVHDSLGDGYAAAGRREQAAAAARRALELLPADPARDGPGERAIRDSANAKLAPAG